MKTLTQKEARTALSELNPQRVILVHPTKFLGNLLISGRLIQHYLELCANKGVKVLLILDAQYEPLIRNQLPSSCQVLWYPRSQLGQASLLRKIRLFYAFMRQMNAFRADLAFTLESDTVASHLLRLSGARFRLTCNAARISVGFSASLNVEFSDRNNNEEHRWYSYQEVFLSIPGISAEHLGNPDYFLFNVNLFNKIGLEHKAISNLAPAPFVAVHAGASKAYKRWPLENFTELCRLLLDAGYTPVLIGAGKHDEAAAQTIIESLKNRNPSCGTSTVNLCNQLDLPALAALLQSAQAVVGNDSGPSHLASALGTPGVVLFGPTEEKIWGPLGAQTCLLHKKSLCRSDCTRHHCVQGYACLTQISATEVYEMIIKIKRVGDLINVRN